MRLLLILMLVGYASATLLQALEEEKEAMVNDFVKGIHSGPPLHEALGIEDNDEVQRLERSIKDELEKHIKEAFKKTLKKIEDAVKNGKKVNPEALKRLKDLEEKMKDLNIDDSEVDMELDALKKIVDTQLRLILEKMGIFDKRSADTADELLQSDELFQSMLGNLSIREMFMKLKDMILEKLNVGQVKDSLSKILGEGAKKLCEWITNKGKEKVMNFFDRVLDADEVDKRSATHIDAVKEILQNADQDIDNKLERFSEWLDVLLRRGIDGSWERLQNFDALSKEILSHSEGLSKEWLSGVFTNLLQSRDKVIYLNNLSYAIKTILNKEQ